jgi:hypothetical protein
MTAHKPAPTPTSLGTAGKRLWRETAKVYELRQDELEILRSACREADLIEKMDAELKGASLLVPGSMGQDVINPLLQEVRQHRAAFAALIRALKLPDEPEGVPQVNGQRTGGQTRWGATHGATA